MKPKILLVKYADWVVIAGLAILLIYALLKALIPDTTVEKLSGDIARLDTDIKKAIISTDYPITLKNKPDLLTEFRHRLERLPVISSYADNPFFPEEDIAPRAPILLKKGQSMELAIEGPHFIELVDTNPKVVKLEFDYNPEERMSLLAVEALDEGTAIVRIDTVQGQTYRFVFIVQEKPTYAAPNPPYNVVMDPLGRYEDAETERPPRVLMTFRHNNPAVPTRDVGITTGAHVYRKSAEAPDAEFVRLTREPLALSPNEKIGQIWKWVYPRPKRLTSEEQGSEGATGSPPGSRDPEIPPTADELAPGRGLGPAGVWAPRRPSPPVYVFVDQLVDEGESYVYKIVTVSAVPDVPDPVECKNPFVNRRPVVVPSFVIMDVQSASLMRATVYAIRPDPETGRPIRERFSLVPGMTIGGLRRLKRQTRGIWPPGPEYLIVDFSTDSVLVDSLPFLRRIEYRVRWDRKQNNFVYKVRQASDPRILYLTPRGSLRWKGKRGAARGSFGGRGLAGPGSPGGRPRY